MKENNEKGKIKKSLLLGILVTQAFHGGKKKGKKRKLFERERKKRSWNKEKRREKLLMYVKRDPIFVCVS